MDYKITLGWFNKKGEGPYPDTSFSEPKGTRGYIGSNSVSKTIKEWYEGELLGTAEEIYNPHDEHYGYMLVWYENE